MKRFAFYSVILVLACSSCKSLGHGGNGKHANDNTVSRNDAMSVQQAKEEYLFVQGCIERSLGNIPEAEAQFQQILASDPTNAAANYEMAGLYRSQNDLPNALRFAQEAVKNNATNEWYFIREAEILELLGRRDESIAAYNSACSLDKQNTDLLFRLANEQVTAKKYPDALSTFSKIESIEGLSDTLCNSRLNVYSQTGDITMQGKTYRDLIAAFPDEKENYYRYAEFSRESGMIDSAMKTYSTISIKYPDDPRAWLGIANVEQTKDHVDAFKTARIAFNYHGEVPEKVILLKTWYPVSDSSAALSSAQQTEADTLCAILRRVDPEDALSYSVSGDYLYRQKKFKDARAMYAQAVVLDGNSYDTWKKILALNQLLNDDAQQEKDCNSLIDLYPAQPDAYYYLGILQLKKNDFSHSAANLQMAKDNSISNVSFSSMIDMQLVAAYRGKGDDAKADAVCEESIAGDSTNYAMMITYASSLEKRKIKLEEAQALTTKYLKMYPDNAAALELMGDILFRLGNKNDALLYWQKAKAAGVSDPTLDKKIATGSID
ncbi:MAG TPA: tetratricopeptide repeat protein [Bacteroidia bacterium]|jgi:tetratricopeptide (TPR) repeat protein|nr:tetratricopeptide repeat protein [Bacteroidia bacterium]